MEWLNYKAHVRGDINIQHKGNGPEVKIGSKHLPVNGYHAESETIFQFHGCMFHGHTCQDPKDPDASWLGLTLQQRRDRTERVHEYLHRGCGYHVVTMWECRWKYMKQSDPAIREFIKANLSETDINSDEPIPDPGSDMESILQAIQDDKLFGMALVDLHTPEVLKHKFRDLPPIFKRTEVGRADIGEHMKKYCEESGLLPSPRPMLISSYFAVNTLIATPLLKWYIDMGLVVTRVYMVMQYRRRRCFLRVTENAAEKRRIADLDSSQKLAGESTKLLANSIYGKTCDENRDSKKSNSWVGQPHQQLYVQNDSMTWPNWKHMENCQCLPTPKTGPWTQTLWLPCKTCVMSMKSQKDLTCTNYPWHPERSTWTCSSILHFLYIYMPKCACSSSDSKWWRSTWNTTNGVHYIWTLIRIT